MNQWKTNRSRRDEKDKSGMKRIEKGLKREPATHPKFVENPEDSDRLACERYHQGDGRVHLGLLWQCSEGPYSKSNRIRLDSMEIDESEAEFYALLFGFSFGVVWLDTLLRLKWVVWGLFVDKRKRRKGFLAPGEGDSFLSERDGFSAVGFIDDLSTTMCLALFSRTATCTRGEMKAIHCVSSGHVAFILQVGVLGPTFRTSNVWWNPCWTRTQGTRFFFFLVPFNVLNVSWNELFYINIVIVHFCNNCVQKILHFPNNFQGGFSCVPLLQGKMIILSLFKLRKTQK